MFWSEVPGDPGPAANTKFTLGVQADSWPHSLLRRGSRLTHSSVRVQTCLWKIYLRNSWDGLGRGRREGGRGKNKMEAFPSTPLLTSSCEKVFCLMLQKRKLIWFTWSKYFPCAESFSAVSARLDPNKEVILSKAEHWWLHSKIYSKGNQMVNANTWALKAESVGIWPLVYIIQI